METTLNTNSPPLLFKKTRLGLLLIIISHILLLVMIMTQVFLEDIISIFSIFALLASLLFLIGLVAIFYEKQYYEIKQQELIFNAFILLLISIFAGFFHKGVGNILSAIAFCMIIYNWIPSKYRILIYTYITISIIAGIINLDHISYVYSPGSVGIVFTENILAIIFILIKSAIFLFMYGSLYISAVKLPVPTYPIYQQPRPLKELQIINKSLDESAIKICPFCDAELEEEWRICHSCKKVLPK